MQNIQPTAGREYNALLANFAKNKNFQSREKSNLLKWMVITCIVLAMLGGLIAFFAINSVKERKEND